MCCKILRRSAPQNDIELGMFLNPFTTLLVHTFITKNVSIVLWFTHSGFSMRRKPIFS